MQTTTQTTYPFSPISNQDRICLEANRGPFVGENLIIQNLVFGENILVQSLNVSMTEHLAICVHYLHRPSSNEVEFNEAFLGFVGFPRRDAATITNSLSQHFMK